MEYFYDIMGQHIEQGLNITMISIDIGRKYLPIPQDHYIAKLQIKAADTVDNTRTPGSIEGCAIEGRV